MGSCCPLLAQNKTREVGTHRKEVKIPILVAESATKDGAPDEVSR